MIVIFYDLEHEIAHFVLVLLAQHLANDSCVFILWQFLVTLDFITIHYYKYTDLNIEIFARFKRLAF